MPVCARRHAGRVEDRVLGHRPGCIVETNRALARLRGRKCDRFDLDDAAEIVVRRLGRTSCRSRATRRARTSVCGTSRLVCTTARTSSSVSVTGALLFLAIDPVERLTVSVGNNLHRFAAFDRVRGNELRNAARCFRAKAFDRALHDRHDLMLREWREDKSPTQRERIAGSISSGSRVVAPIKTKSAGAPSLNRRLMYAGTLVAFSS